ncbi:hypothetical protein ABT352_32730 [Streptosporangium sp. NPDC000563]|uniref:hypothetical protein n=1 Tax=Streptosporangium sp. NPDC000563 TaxID=3154366 RepID=UPI0033274FBC
MIIEGYIDGIYYAVTAGTPRPEAAATIGVVSGSRHAVLLLEMHNGRETPAGEILDVEDAESVRAALEALTDNVRVRPSEG